MKSFGIRGGARMSPAWYTVNMEAPPHLLEREPNVQIALAVGGPLIFGAIGGLLIGFSETAYLIYSLVAILGGIAAGYEHPTGDEGSVRGFCAGLVFSSAILAVSAVSGLEPQANLPHPPGMLVPVVAVLSAVFGAIGGWLRKRHDRRERLASRETANA